MTPTRRRLSGPLALLAATALALSACSAASTEDGKGSAGTAGTAGGPSAASLPASIRSSGVLRVGTNVPYVPMEMLGDDGRSYAGIDMDLITAAAERLGLKVKISNSSWDGLIPALNAGRYDVLAASFGDFVERQKTVDLVDMLRGGVSGIARHGEGATYADPSALCGVDVGVENGSATVSLADQLSDACKKAGSPAVTKKVFPTDAGAMVALQSGRVDVVLDDSVIARHLTSTQPTRYDLALPDAGAPFLYGFVVSKRNAGLSKALAGAVNELVADGTYAKICAKYGIDGSLLVPQATINAGTTSADQA